MKPRAKPVQTNLDLAIPHRELLEQTAEQHEWTLTETVVRGVRLLGELMELYGRKLDSLAVKHPEHAALLRRVVRELPLELLVNRDVALGHNGADGAPALNLSDFLIVTSPDGDLLAIRRIGNTIEVSRVHSGLIEPLGVFPKTENELDQWPLASE